MELVSCFVGWYLASQTAGLHMRKLHQQRWYSVMGGERQVVQWEMKGPLWKVILQGDGYCKCSFPAVPKSKFLSPNLSSATYFRTFKPSDKTGKEGPCNVQINQPDATLLMNDLYFPLLGCSCFGLSPVHHQEHQLINCITLATARLA